MKRAGNLINSIAEPENLRLAFYKAHKGKSHKQEVKEFTEQLDKNLLRLRNHILSGQADVGNYHYFTVYDPKKRMICAASFPERVLHHALMTICNPVFERFQIYYSYACRKGKGTYAALERAESFQQKYRFFLKLDVRKYFDTIDHQFLKEKLHRIFKDDLLLEIFDQIINSYSVSPGKGIPIGNLTSQYFANHCLAYIDHYVKEVLGIPAYVRYMDDMVLWANNKSELLLKGRELEKYISSTMKQVVKPVCLNSTEKGLPFLGYLLFPGCVRLAARSRQRYARKLKSYYHMLESGEWEQKDFQRHVLPLLAFTGHARSKGFRQHVEMKIRGQ